VIYNQKTYDISLSRTYTIYNKLFTKLVHISILLPAYNKHYLELIKLEGKPLCGLRDGRNGNVFIHYRLHSLKARETTIIASTLLLKRKTSVYFPGTKNLGTLSDIPKTYKIRYLQGAYEYITRRVRRIAERILRKTNDISEIQHMIIEFLNRNFKKSMEEEEEDPFLVFQRGYGGPRSFAIAFALLNAQLGIPVRLVTGWLLNIENKKINPHYWCEILSQRNWIPYDPWLGLEGKISSGHIPIKIDNPFRKTSDILVKYKTVEKISRKAIVIEENFIEIRARVNNEYMVVKREERRNVY